MTYYVYVLKSLRDGTQYIGSTQNISIRVKEHNRGKQQFTKGRTPWELIHTEEYTSRSEALKRERYLKTSTGRRLLKKILENQ